jgi:hypothetical protein
MRRIFIICFLATLPYAVKSQQADTVYRNQVKLSMLPLVNVLNPGVELSYERVFKKFSGQVISGYPTNILGSPYTRLRGYSLAVEGKCFSSRTTKWRRYFSIEAGTHTRSFQETTSEMDPLSNTIVTDTFTVHRKWQALSAKFGIQLIKNHFVLDMSIGAGTRHLEVKHADRMFQYPELREFFDLHQQMKSEQNVMQFILPVSLRIGYCF